MQVIQTTSLTSKQIYDAIEEKLNHEFPDEFIQKGSKIQKEETTIEILAFSTHHIQLLIQTENERKIVDLQMDDIGIHECILEYNETYEVKDRLFQLYIIIKSLLFLKRNRIKMKIKLQKLEEEMNKKADK